MTETQEFIEDAIKGGYEYREAYNYHFALDLKAWEAVGKTRGWKEPNNYYGFNEFWKDKWHCFIDHLADGKSIEESLALIK